ncbi:MAG: peptide chain release factor N(5)-glutamine methyltransferase [Deltaproteobacteria bacterium]|nr:peptide chain release factor N(5)-glutamine methyltransferase [Deltaproteobacteria bacterium]MBW1951920.1 peptide chain release factor N(5)-glutamine methyltransferase [Deltaproteobacteria bacterium]MBW1986332.1 peptide chain release factor N(5)-glutamine methyltransferase [Deltaproteobacteria bacterium]MBW2134374.1 peptide chain release factor N(5)-glutamine methyltransferase [Deltaproteobacteria bacterium]
MTADPGAAWTIMELLCWTTSYFHHKGISEPRASAEVLLAHCLGRGRLALYLQHDQPLSTAELANFKELIRRRLAGEPTQYITGHQEFWSLDFLVNPAVLIPRPETEILIDTVLKQVQQPDFPLAQGPLLDLGTGSGVLAIVLARELPVARFVALDLSAAALAVAQENARRHQVVERIGFIRGDLFQPLAPRPTFSVIISNPPYVPTREWQHLPREIRHYEPRAALDGGPDGLAVIRRLVSEAHQYLIPGGLLALEVGQGQASAVLDLLLQQGAYAPAETRYDYQKIQRVVFARRLE